MTAAADRLLRLRRRRRLLLEAFLAGNLLFLAVDVLLAHSVNSFREPVEWLPFWFSLVGGLAVAVPLLLRRRPDAGWSRMLGSVVGVAAVLVGILGAYHHLESRFFQEWTFASLVYAAPFVAPLAYAGLGCLLLVNRFSVRSRAAGLPGWGRWVVLFAAGGFAGNFLLALLDHEQNGFWYWTEWIPVAAAALGVSALVRVVAGSGVPERGLVRLTVRILAAQVVVSIAGFVLHLGAAFRGSFGSTAEAIIHGAPPFAPLLFADLAVLAGIGLLSIPAPPADGS